MTVSGDVRGGRGAYFPTDKYAPLALFKGNERSENTPILFLSICCIKHQLQHESRDSESKNGALLVLDSL